MTKTNLQLCKKMMKKERPDMWTAEVSLYLEDIRFYHKRNPYDQARAPKGQIWRKKSEGLKEGCAT